MSDSRRALLGNTLYSSIGLYADYAASLIISIIIARHLGPERFGTYTLLIWFSAVGVALSNNGITTGVMKFLGEARGQRAPALARSVLRYLERMQLSSTLAVCVALAHTVPRRLGRPISAFMQWAAKATTLAPREA